VITLRSGKSRREVEVQLETAAMAGKLLFADERRPLDFSHQKLNTFAEIISIQKGS
jgi:hypothetical protein